MAGFRLALMTFLIVALASPTGFQSSTGTPSPSTEAVPIWGYQVVAEYPHDPEAYTQGLDIDQGELFEGTGLNGSSSLRRVDLETGEVLQSHNLKKKYFGEGIQVVGDRIYQITWQEQTCFVYDRDTFEVIETFSYDTEGWGLAYDGELLIMSDGSSRITYRDPATFDVVRSIDVTYQGEEVSSLNELELIDGMIWANVYQTDFIAIIDPSSGHVTAWIDLTGLMSDQEREASGAEVLNGIAQDPDTGKIYVTGKLWPKLYEIELVTQGSR